MIEDQTTMQMTESIQDWAASSRDGGGSEDEGRRLIQIPPVPVETLELDLSKLCARKQVEMNTVKSGILSVRETVHNLFQAVDITHLHHLQNVERLLKAIFESDEFKEILHEAEEQLEHQRPFIQQLRDTSLQRELIVAAGLHDIGKLHPEVQPQLHKRPGDPTFQFDVIKRHVGVLEIFRQLGITPETHPTLVSVAAFHHFPAYFGAEPHDDRLLALPEGAIQGEVLAGIPIWLTLVKAVDIIEAMSSRLRIYQQDRLNSSLRWWENQKEAKFRIGGVLAGRLPTSMEEELRKKCPENPEFAVDILKIVRRNWVTGAALGRNLVRSQEQLTRADTGRFATLKKTHQTSTN